MGALTVGIVVDDFDQAATYLEQGPVEEYVIIKEAGDVPASLGGVAFLRTGDLDPELRDALVHAMGVGSWPEP